jgi:hypothetical protein
VGLDRDWMREKIDRCGSGLRTAGRTAQRGTRLWALLFAVLGCASETKEEPEQRDPTVEQFATFVDLYADMVCGLVERCCNEVNQALYTLSGDEACRDVVEAEAALAQVGTFGSMGAKSSTYREDRQRACKSALEASDCEALEAGWPAACEESWFEGTVPLGGTCDTSAECIDSYCLRPASARVARKDMIHLLLGPWPEVPKGTCVAPLGDGADCVEDYECQSNSCEDDVCESTPPALDAMCPL